MTSPSPHHVLDVALRNAAEGAVDAVRRRARSDVSRWIAGANGLRRLVKLARTEAAPADASESETRPTRAARRPRT